MYSLIKTPKPKPYSINTKSDSAPMTKPTSPKFYILNYHHKSSNKPTNRGKICSCKLYKGFQRLNSTAQF